MRVIRDLSSFSKSKKLNDNDSQVLERAKIYYWKNGGYRLYPFGGCTKAIKKSAE
jgi:hypothetical protein